MSLQDPEQNPTDDKQNVIEEAEALLKSKALEDRDRVLSEMRASRGDKVFASLPIKVVEDLRHFELDVHDVVQSVEFEGQVGDTRAWRVCTLNDVCIVVYNSVVHQVCGRFNEDAGSLDLIALLYGIVDKSGIVDQVHKRISEGKWPE